MKDKRRIAWLILAHPAGIILSSCLVCSAIAAGTALGADAAEPSKGRTYIGAPPPGTLALSNGQTVSGNPAAVPPAVSPSTASAPSATEGPTPAESAPATSLGEQLTKPPKYEKHEISASGDFFYGQGHVTMPFNFSLVQVPGLRDAGVQQQVGHPSRESIYYGGTLSYSYGQKWYLDLSYAQGSSSGSTAAPLGPTFNLPTTFKIDDTWYQAYIRYEFPRLLGSRRLKAYLRAGASYVTADLFVPEVNVPGLGLYEQTDKTEDILGNLGFGLRYSLLPHPKRAKLYLQLEGEGFYGSRSQKSLEQLPATEVTFPTAEIDNALYGGIGRGTVRLEYAFGRSGLFRGFIDGGVQAKFTQIHYSGLGTFDELLWGPYVKLGVRYAF